MIWRRLAGGVAMLACCGTIAACGSSDEPDEHRQQRDAGRHRDAGGESKTGEQSEFFVQADYDKQLAQRSATPEGPADKPWEQMIEPGEMVDTAEFKSDKAEGWNVCFSNAANDNPWRQNGWHHDEGRGRQHAGDRQVHGRRRRGEGRQADLRHRGA